MVRELGFPGCFLIVHDICEFCRRTGILARGYGLAVSSVVCFALGIINVDPTSARPLFKRLLLPERGGLPDVDVSIESGHRGEVIQYVYEKYGCDSAAQAANAITYQRHGALCDAARVLGYSLGVTDTWIRDREAYLTESVWQLAEQFRKRPRHLDIHSGGMVICDWLIADVVPVERTHMEGRLVVQWDKGDCTAAGLVKFNLLGLGMLETIYHYIDLVYGQHGRRASLWEVDIAELEVYEMLARTDAMGVFQVESCVQLVTLPRLKPGEFFDLVVKVVLIHPGPIRGDSVHPYIRHQDRLEPVVYGHPVLEKSSGKTLGIPLLQKQPMQMAVDAASFSRVEADSLRRAMGSRHSMVKMKALHARFPVGPERTSGADEDVGEQLWNRVVVFAAYGFPESHAQLFVSLVYFSAWSKYHYPAKFCATLLHAQPMGFYSSQSLTVDARRHGIGCDGPDTVLSGMEANVIDGRIRLGLDAIAGVDNDVAEHTVAARPFVNAADVARGTWLDVGHMEALARVGTLRPLGINRRQALWTTGVAATESEGMLPGLTLTDASALPGMTEFELAAANLVATGMTPRQYPVATLREDLQERGVVPAAELEAVPDGTRVEVTGAVTHRQRPGITDEVIFLGMEDETGLVNVLCIPGLWNRFRLVTVNSRATMVRGIAQTVFGVATIVADRLADMSEALGRPVAAGRGRDSR